MISRSHKQALLSVLVATVLGGVVVADAVAQSRSSERRSSRGGSAKAEVLFPEATREEPKGKSSSKMGSKLQKLFAAYNKQEFEETRTLADEIIAAADANDYDKAVANQLGSQAAYNLDDNAGAKGYLQQAIALNQLDNNGHYQALLMLAQLQLQDEQYAEGLANLDKYFAESKSHKPEEMVIKGQALYQLERFKEAVGPLKQAIDTSPEPKDNWVQLLMATYAETGQNAEAIALAEQLAAKNPTDKKAQTNLATVYAQADQMDKAAAVLEKLRAAGQLTDEREYRQLYITYANMDGREKDVISVINEGLQKGILKPDHQTYLALAQSYYYSEQIPQAIENWQKAAPLSKDGETYLNLARVLWQEDRIAEAKQAAKQALDKGVKKPDDARKIINLK